MSTPTPAAINVFLDSDGPIADFDVNLKASGLSTDAFKHQAGTYLWLPVTPGAVAGIASLKALDDEGLIRVWILTKTPSKCPYAYTEKVLWYRQHFPWLEDRVIITHDKHLMGTEDDFLLDDRPHKANVELFRGTFMFFDVRSPKECWINFARSVRAKVVQHLTQSKTDTE